MPIVQWMIKNDNDDCQITSDPASPPVITIKKISNLYQPRYLGYPVTELVVVFRTDVQADDPNTSSFALIFETETNEPDPLLVSEARFKSVGAAKVTDARCTWVINNGSAVTKGLITVTVFNHEVKDGAVEWTLDHVTGSPPAKLALTVKRQDAAINCS